MSWNPFPRRHSRAAVRTRLAVEPLEDRMTPVTLPPGYVDSLVAGGLSHPTTMAFAPDGRLFVAEQGGTLRVITDGTLLPTPFVSLNVDSTGERGLLGIAFDPNFETNGFVYLYYTATTPTTHNRVSRFTANGDVAAAGSEVDLLDLENLTNTIHNAGAIHFGPDGKLYVAVGDNGISANSQTLDNRLGKMLRINPDGSIPTDNPFYDVATGANRAIWALGLRNPFTFDFQPGTGRMFINDVGLSTWEEIDEGFAGGNYGWPYSEGFRQPTDQVTTIGTYHDPLFEYGHGTGPTVGAAIVGAAFYDPTFVQYPNEVGQYFFADLGSGWIRSYSTYTGAVSLFATGLYLPVDLAVSPDGALYYYEGAFGTSGEVHRISLGAGPRVISSGVSGFYTTEVGISDDVITFDRPVNPASLTASQVQLTGPNGPIAVTISPFGAGNDTQFDLHFAEQVQPGTYTLVIGPDVTDFNGNPMDQNENGIAGEGSADAFTTSATLYIYTNFAGAFAPGFAPQSGAWTFGAGGYVANGGGGDAVSTTAITSGPNGLYGAALTTGAGGNAYLIFDDQGPADFKFAGIDIASQQWQVGHRDAAGWHVDASTFDPSLTADTTYDVSLQIIQGETAALSTPGTNRAAFTFAGLIGNGTTGLGTDGAAATFGVFAAQPFTPAWLPTPFYTNFATGAAAFTPRAGAWNAAGPSRYLGVATPGGDAVSTLQVYPIPTVAVLSAAATAVDVGGGFGANAYIIFDYEGAQSFKFAGFDVASQQWQIGHRDATGWHIDASLHDGSLTTGVAHGLNIRIDGGTVTLAADGVSRASYTFGTDLRIGFAGIGAQNAEAQFGTFAVGAG